MFRRTIYHFGFAIFALCLFAVGSPANALTAKELAVAGFSTLVTADAETPLTHPLILAECTASLDAVELLADNAFSPPGREVPGTTTINARGTLSFDLMTADLTNHSLSLVT